MIQKFAQANPNRFLSKKREANTNVFTFQIETGLGVTRIILVQPVSQFIIDKLASHHYLTIDGVIILLLMNYQESFEAARTFYGRVRKINPKTRIPVVFVEVVTNTALDSKKPEILENTPNIAYFGITEETVKAFENVLRFLIDHRLE
jgi:hypothetical protein